MLVACEDEVATAPDARSSDDGSGAHFPVTADEVVTPIAIEPLSARHQFTDDFSAQFRLKPDGRPMAVVNLQGASRLAVLKITVQPGARFPWHTHPGPVLVAITQGELVYTYADDCIERNYPSGTALVDPGTNVHYAYNPTSAETVLIATFFGVPAAGPLTIPVTSEAGAGYDSKCSVAPAVMGSH
ncbi:MAG TPA: cupin domain-containing protein [Gemmatimonadales bacterium]|nr:cupin domain-containing protein [Gemmatimonadales bacterium]